MRVLVPLVAILSLVHAVTLPNLLGRAPLDICASVHAELVVPDVQGVLTAVGLIDICLCVSAIPLFLQTNVVAILAVTIAGEQVVTAILISLITGAAPQQCNYPDNSTPTCISGNPCGFTCINGFESSPASNPTNCVCPSPKQVCNGVCTDSLTCPSSTPSRREEGWWQKRMSCDFGHTACGSTSSSAYECVDTKSNLENCGGCGILLNDYSPKGRDCSAIPDVAGVSCDQGTCKIHECMPGYTASFDNSTCYDMEQFSFAREAVQKYRRASGLI